MQKKNPVALMLPVLLMIAALACGVYAQSKKHVLPAAAPVKTVKVLASRLAAAPRTEFTKAKKTAAPVLKATAKPVAVTKLSFSPTARKNAASNKAIQPATKAKLVKPAPTTKLAAQDARGKAPQLRLPQLYLNDGLRKGKFGKDARPASAQPAEETARFTETKRELKPAETKRSAELIAANRDDEETPARRIRPRIAESEPKEKTKDDNDARPAAEERIADAPKLPIAKPDRIEVIEPNSPQITQLLALPNTRPTAAYGAIVTRTSTPPAARKDIGIPQQRVFEIQYELAKRGFYTAEPNGLYDDVTVAAMWEFQKNYGLPATGYPTAHALKRLGLTSW